MATNKVSYQTNFTGIKYSNNPLAIDINSFSTSNNVYLNKYGTLISRPPISALDYPYQVYSDINPKPDHLKLVSTYSLSNGGIVYVIFNTDTKKYTLRYKSPLDEYSAVINSTSIVSTKDFALTAYKQYYIMFTVNGTRALDTTSASNSWVALSTIVDVPVTSIQTGNERLTIPGNQITSSYKSQYIVKADSDDTIYNLPVGETAAVTFPNQTDVTYDMTKADEYTRSRLLSKLNTPANNSTDVLISMAGEKIAIAHDDRVDISLDYGDTFTTIPYPTPGGVDYKNTASISDDGLCFFYVHTNGVYRYEIGINNWTLIEPVLDYTVTAQSPFALAYLEAQVTGLPITTAMQGANYCHFINAERFAFALAYYNSTIDRWYGAFYVKGTNLSNLLDSNLVSRPDVLNSFAKINGTDFGLIGEASEFALWKQSPYINKNRLLILDADTIVAYWYHNAATNTMFIKKAPTHLYQSPSMSTTINSQTIDYLTIATNTLRHDTYGYYVTKVLPADTNTVKVLLHNKAWCTIQYNLTYSEVEGELLKTYTFVFSNTKTYLPLTGVPELDDESHNYYLPLFYIKPNIYLVNNKILILNETYAVTDSYTLPIPESSVGDKVISSGPYYIIFNETTNSWHTNISKQAVLTYTYLSSAEFTQVPTAVYDDQHLWLAMNKTLWIGYLIDNKLSIPAINNNDFSKQITAICPISPTSKAIFFSDSVSLCDEVVLSDNTLAWQYHSLKFSVGVRQGDTVITTNDGKLTLFPTKYGLAALTYQLDIAATEQAITYLTDDIKSMWAEFYTASSTIKMLHHNTQLILANGTNKVLIFDFRTNGWYPLTFPAKVNISKIQPSLANHEILELQPIDAAITSLTGLYQLRKEHDELYSYDIPYKDLSTTIIPWSLTSQLLLLDAPNNYKNITQLIIDQVDSSTLSQSAYLTTLLFRQHGNLTKPAIELVYSIDTFAKIIKKVNWWKVLGIKWQLSSDDKSSYPTQLRLYNFSITYDISYEVK